MLSKAYRPMMKLDCWRLVNFCIQGWRRLANSLKTNLVMTLHRDISLNWARNSGLSPFGMRPISALLASLGNRLDCSTPWTTEFQIGPQFPNVVGRSLEENHQALALHPQPFEIVHFLPLQVPHPCLTKPFPSDPKEGRHMCRDPVGGSTPLCIKFGRNP